MKTALKKIGVVSTLMTGFLSSAGQAFAQIQTWTGVCVDGPDNDVATIQGLQCLVGNVLQVAMTIIGLAGFAMIIYGGFKFMVSGGSSKATETARQTLTYAIIGLVVALSSFFIINIISSFTGISAIKQFTIPSSTSTTISPGSQPGPVHAPGGGR